MVSYLFLILLFFLACSDRKRTNPLDLRNPVTGGRPAPLQAIAGDRTVTLSWNFSSYSDITGYRLYKREDGHSTGSPLSPLPFDAFIHSTDDEHVTNGSTYFYSMSILSDEGESAPSYEVPATPGPEVCWVADAGSGSIVRISPDARQIAARIGGFQHPVNIAVHPIDGSCWVADDERKGMYRITTDNIPQRVVPLEAPADLSIDVDGLCWVVDSQRVVYFSTEEPFPPVPHVVDANFISPVSVASIGSYHCWIADSEGNRVILYNALLGTTVFSLQDIPAPRLLVPDVADSTCWIVSNEPFSLSKLSLRSRSILFTIEELDTSGYIYGIDVDRTTGHCWVATTHRLYRLNRDGHVEVAIETLPGIFAVSVNKNNGTCWAISRDSVYKLTAEGTVTASVGGMLYPTDVALDSRSMK